VVVHLDQGEASSYSRVNRPDEGISGHDPSINLSNGVVIGDEKGMVDKEDWVTPRSADICEQESKVFTRLGKQVVVNLAPDQVGQPNDSHQFASDSRFATPSR
jgi:hypothetical protein